MKNPSDIDSMIAKKREQTRKLRLTVILSTLIIVVCCVIVIAMKHEKRTAEYRRQEMARQAEYEAMQIRRQEEEERRAEELRKWSEEAIRRQDTIAALPRVEEPDEPKYSWDDVENMVRDLTNENYYASTWWDEENPPTCVVIYTKGGKQYFRRFNPEKKTYGPKVRVIKESIGKYHASGNKRDRYLYDGGGNLIHEVNGKEKERFSNFRLIDLYTPEPVPDGYDSWEDYYYDNEEDLREYYR